MRARWNIGHWCFVLLMVLSLGGCATSGATFTEMQATNSLPPAGLGRIYVYRSTAMGAGVQPNVKLNGEVVGSAIPHGFFFLDRPPGTYRISASTEVERDLDLTLEPGQVRFVILRLSMGFLIGHVSPELVDNATGQKAIAGLHYTGTAVPPPK